MIRQNRKTAETLDAIAWDVSAGTPSSSADLIRTTSGSTVASGLSGTAGRGRVLVQPPGQLGLRHLRPVSCPASPAAPSVIFIFCPREIAYRSCPPPAGNTRLPGCQLPPVTY